MRRRRRPAVALSVDAPPVLRAGTEAPIAIAVEGDVRVRVFLRRLGWDMRSPQRFPLGETDGAGTLTAAIPAGLAPGCARLCEYAVYAEALPPGGRLIAAAQPVGLIGDAFPDPGAEAVPRGGVVRGRLPAPAERVEVGPELRVAHELPRFLAAATAAPDADGTFAVTLPEDVPPSLFDGEDITVSWRIRAGDHDAPLTVTDPTGAAAERRPALLTFLAQLARDPFALRPG